MNNRGFTLLELLVVVLLVGILGAIALPQYFNVVERQRAMEAMGILAAIEKAQVRYYAVNDAYSTDFSNIDFDLRSNKGNGNENVTGSSFDTEYFTYTLSSDKVEAKRVNNNFTITTTYAAGDDGVTETCCTATGDRTDICEIINIKECGSSSSGD